MDKKQFITSLVLLILLLGTILGVSLVKQQQTIKGRAAFVPRATFVNLQGNEISETNDPHVKLRIIRELAQATPIQSPTPTPTSLPISPTPTVPIGFGKAIKLTTLNSYIKTPYNFVVDVFGSNSPSSGLSVEAWIKPTSATLFGPNAVNGSTVVARETIGNGVQGFRLGVSGERKTEFIIALQHPGEAPRNVRVAGTTILEADKWYHLAGEYFPYEAGEVRLFVNGTRESTVRANGTRFDVTGSNLAIGCALIRNFGCGNQFYGEIDDVRIIGGATHHLSFAPPTRPLTVDILGVVGLWHLDGNTLDVSNNRNNGEIFGDVQFVNSTVGQ